jgi:hypothetical protein
MRAIALIVCAIAVVIPLSALQQVIADIPEVRGPFTLTAIYYRTLRLDTMYSHTPVKLFRPLSSPKEGLACALNACPSLTSIVVTMCWVTDRVVLQVPHKHSMFYRTVAVTGSLPLETCAFALRYEDFHGPRVLLAVRPSNGYRV